MREEQTNRDSRDVNENQPNSVEITDMIGRNGKYQVLSLFVALYVIGSYGTVSMFVEFEVPDVHLYWTPNSTDFNDTESIYGGVCRMADIYASRPEDNSSVEWTLVYDSKYSKTTLTEKFNIICERSWLMSFSNSLIMIGCLCGSYICGHLSEKIGRRKVYIWLHVPCTFANLLILFSTNYYMFAVGCFLYGFTSTPITNAIFVTVMENISPSRRAIYGTFGKYGMIFGQLVIAGFAWIFQDWFHTQIAHTAFIPSSLLFTWYVLESPVWLAITGREEESIKNLKTIIRRNGKKLQNEDKIIDLWIQSIKKRCLLAQDTTEGHLSDLVSGPTIRKYSIAVPIMVFATYFSYYGLTMNMETFGTDLYVDSMSSIGLSVLSMSLCTASLYWVSIKICTIFFYVSLVVVCILYSVFNDVPLARSVLSALARFFITPPLNTTYIYVYEVYPSSVRGLAMGLVHGLSASLAAGISPFTRELGKRTSTYVPIILFAIMIMIGVAMLWKVLPETKGKPLVHTVKELEAQARGLTREPPKKDEIVGVSYVVTHL